MVLRWKKALQTNYTKKKLCLRSSFKIYMKTHNLLKRWCFSRPYSFLHHDIWKGGRCHCIHDTRCPYVHAHTCVYMFYISYEILNMHAWTHTYINIHIYTHIYSRFEWKLSFSLQTWGQSSARHVTYSLWIIMYYSEWITLHSVLFRMYNIIS